MAITNSHMPHELQASTGAVVEGQAGPPSLDDLVRGLEHFRVPVASCTIGRNVVCPVHNLMEFDSSVDIMTVDYFVDGVDLDGLWTSKSSASP